LRRSLILRDLGRDRDPFRSIECGFGFEAELSRKPPRCESHLSLAENRTISNNYRSIERQHRTPSPTPNHTP
jgi:hypothetical protein